MTKSHKKVFLLLIVIAALYLAYSCFRKEEVVPTMTTNLYFFNKDNSTIVSCEKEIQYDDRNDLFEKTVNELIKGPSGKKYNPIMSKDVTLKSINISDKIMTVDFSGEYDKENLLTTYAVIKTMSQFPDVEKVQVTISGRSALFDGAMSGEEINLESDDDYLAGINLYFADKKKNKLVREYRKINISDTQPIEQYIVSELIKGPNNDNNTSLLSSDTGVISVETTEGTCYVNFKQDFISKNIASDNVQKLIVYSIVNSLTEREHIKNVQFLIEGKKTEQFGNIEIGNILYRDESLISK